MSHAKSSTVYSGRTTNWVALGLTTALIVPLLLVAGPGRSGSWSAAGFVVPLAIVCLAALVNLLTLGSVRTLAGPNGVTVHFGAFGRPRYRYLLADIEEVAAVQIPSSWWSWGISRSSRRGLLLTLRPGPALQLTLRDAKRVTISTPDPQGAVRALRDALG
jgi:hypothetical protein